MNKVVFLALAALLLAGCGQPRVSLEKASEMAVHVAATGRLSPPRRMDDMTALLARGAGGESEAVAKLKAGADARPPEDAAPAALGTFFHHRGMAAWELGRIRQAREDFARARDLAEADGRPVDADTLYQLARAEEFSGNVEAALDILERLRAGTGANARPLRTYGALVRLYAFLGDMERSRKALDQATAMARRFDPAGKKPGVQLAMEFMQASDLEGRNDWRGAEAHLRRGLATLERRVDMPVEAILNRIRLCWGLQLQDRLVDAEIEARRALADAVAQTDREPGITTMAAVRLGEVALAQGRLAEARRLAEALAALLDASGYPPDSLQTLQVLALGGKVKTLLADFPAASADYAAILERTGDDPALRARVLRGAVTMPLAQLMAGRPAEALEHAATSYEQLAARFGPRNTLAAEYLAVAGAAKARLGRNEEAYGDLSRAMEVLLARADEEGRDSGRTVRLRYLVGEWIGLLQGRYAQAPGSARAAEALDDAFRAAEAAGGKAVRRALAAQSARAEGQDPALAALARQEQDLAMHEASLQGNLLELATGSGNGELMGDARARLDELAAARRTLLDEIARRFPQYASLVAPRPPGVDEARAALRPGEALVVVFPAEERTFVWCVPAQGAARFASVELGRGDLEQDVAGLRKALDVDAATLAGIPRFDVGLSHRLYGALFGPVAEPLERAATLLAVVRPPLDRLPLGVLVTADASLGKDRRRLFDSYRRIPWLATRQALAVIPSVGAWLGLRTQPPAPADRRPFVGFGDPVFSADQAQRAEAEASSGGMRPRGLRVRSVRGTARGSLDLAGVSSDLSALSPLPDTREEVRAMAAALGADPEADVFLGREASRSRVLGMDLSDRRILAFATHALVPGDLDGLDQPALALSSSQATGRADDGLLTQEDILRLRLNADWVVLSACNTGAAEGEGAEAVSGLGRAFFYAGARALLVSMWSVETTSARELTTGLFAALARTPGQGRAGALKESVARLITGPGLVEDGVEASYAHPFFWAPFVLVGEPGGAAP